MTVALSDPKPTLSGCLTGCWVPWSAGGVSPPGAESKAQPPPRAGWQHADEGYKLG